MAKSSTKNTDMTASKFKIVKICERCGKEFLAQKRSTRFCSHQCSSMAYKDAKRLERKKATEARVRARVQEIVQSEVGEKELLTFREAAKLLGITKQAMYALVARGTLVAYKLTRRISRIRKTDIDQMLLNNPYVSSPLRSKKERETITEFYTTKEVLEIFSISNSWLFTVAKRQNIPKVTQHGKTYWSKKHCDMIFGKKDSSVDEITEWYSVPEIQKKYGMTLSAIYCLVSKVGIPKKKEGKEVRYSKKHFDAAKGTAESVESEWYSIAEATEKFNMSRDQLHYYIKTYKVKKKMVGKYCYLAKDEVDALFENIFTPPSI